MSNAWLGPNCSKAKSELCLQRFGVVFSKCQIGVEPFMLVGLRPLPAP